MLMLDRIFQQLIEQGELTVIGPDGARRRYGHGKPQLTIKLHNQRAAWRIALRPGMALGECYMDGSLTIEQGDVYDLLDMTLRNLGWQHGHWFFELTARLNRLRRRVMQYNPVGRAQQNVAHHYDLSGELYDLFLDADKQYSCAYFDSPNDSLERAQQNKKRHLAAKLQIEPGMRVLDIGCGWGGLGLTLAQETGADVLGVTLSEEQYRTANARAERLGLQHRARFELKDYRLLKEPFDRIVSVGMFEHVGIGHYREFFNKVRDLLSPSGVALLHTIGRAEGPGATNSWITKYIFPGGYSPALSEVAPHIESAGLYLTDLEVLRLHYAETLKHWRRRFIANRDRIKAIYDERFCRMWEFYLAGSEATFRYGGHVVFQFQMAKSQTAIPLTRDYIYEWEHGNRTKVAAE